MNYCQMTNAYIITNVSLSLFVCAMNNSSVLNIDFISQSDLVYVASDHGIEPDGTLVSHDYIAQDSSIGSYKAFISKDW